MSWAVFHLIENLFHSVTALIDALGYGGLVAVVALESVFPPIPSEVVLPLAGYLVSQGRMTFFGAVAAATVGSVIGALVLYGLGHAWGERRVRRLVERYGRWALLTRQDLDRSQRWFDRHGRAAVFVGRLAPLVRSLVSVPAGVTRMSIARFVLYTALGSALWNSALIGAGWLLGESWPRVEQYQQLLTYGVLALLGLAIVWFVARRARAANGARG